MDKKFNKETVDDTLEKLFELGNEEDWKEGKKEHGKEVILKELDSLEEGMRIYIARVRDLITG